MNGLRVTNCKSGKDRTGVGVTLEQCMILARNHDLPREMNQYVLDDLRRFVSAQSNLKLADLTLINFKKKSRNGVRIDIVWKNVGKRKYAFNKIRYFLLPQLYRPPLELCDDLET